MGDEDMIGGVIVMALGTAALIIIASAGLIDTCATHEGRHAQCRDLGGIATADDKCVFVDGGVR